MFLSFYVKEDARRSSVKLENSMITEEQRYLEYREVRGIPDTYPMLCVGVLIGFILALWVYERYTE